MCTRPAWGNLFQINFKAEEKEVVATFCVSCHEFIAVVLLKQLVKDRVYLYEWVRHDLTDRSDCNIL